MKKLVIMLFMVGISCPALCAEEFVYCGNYNSSYLFGSKSFVKKVFKNKVKQVCAIKTNTDESSNVKKCSRRQINKTVNNSLNSCKIMTEATFNEVQRARKHRDWEYYYTIMTSEEVLKYKK